MRLDQWLVARKLFTSRHKAQAEIREGRIRVNGETIKKPSFDVNSTDDVVCETSMNPYVGRGGLKLEHGLDTFRVEAFGKTVIDIGSSTGGFTDCLLQRGAKHVFCVDVGHNQLAQKLVEHPKTTVYESTNFLDTDQTFFPNTNLVVIDVSFTSVLPHLIHLYTFYKGEAIVLFKPQFESGKPVSKGIVRGEKQHIALLKAFAAKLREVNLAMHALTPSPIVGQRGNREFLCLVGFPLSIQPLAIDLIVKESYHH